MCVTNLACDPSNQVMSIRYILEFLSIYNNVRTSKCNKGFHFKTGRSSCIDWGGLFGRHWKRSLLRHGIGKPWISCKAVKRHQQRLCHISLGQHVIQSSKSYSHCGVAWFKAIEPDELGEKFRNTGTAMKLVNVLTSWNLSLFYFRSEPQGWHFIMSLVHPKTMYPS